MYFPKNKPPRVSRRLLEWRLDVRALPGGCFVELQRPRAGRFSDGMSGR